MSLLRRTSPLETSPAMEFPHPVASVCGKVFNEINQGFQSSRVTAAFRKYETLRAAFLDKVKACVQAGGNVEELKPDYSDLMYGSCWGGRECKFTKKSWAAVLSDVRVFFLSTITLLSIVNHNM